MINLSRNGLCSVASLKTSRLNKHIINKHLNLNKAVMDKLKKVNIWRFVEGLGLDLKRKQLIGKLIEEIVDASIEGVPAASNDNIGGIKTGYTQNEKNYPVALDENKKAYVNVPWSDTNTTYEVMGGATSTTNGKAGLVPGAAAGQQTRYLRADGQWMTPPNQTYSKATADALGLVKIGYTANGKNYPVLLDADGKMYVAVPWTNTTYNAATVDNPGLMSRTDKAKLDGIAENANNYSLPAATSAALGGVKQGAAVADAAADADAAALATKINELIASLKAAGVIA